MATTVEFALMAGASYYDTRDAINRFPDPSGWTRVSRFPVASSNGSGFEASVFGDGADITSSTNLVISYAGTYEKDLTGDIAADIGLATGYGSAQLLQAAEYYLQVKALNPNANVAFTGHSLGGGLAALIGVFFGVKATTFDQAPFANSAEQNLLTPNVAANLKAELLAKGYSEVALSGLTNFLQLREANSGIPNSSLVTNLNVQGEFLSGVPWNILDRIGTTVLDISHGATGISRTELHSHALLTAFLLSNQGATGGNNSSLPLNEVSKKLPSLLGLIFDKNLFANDTDTDKSNFLEHLVRHQAGVPDPLASGTFLINPDAMLTHFTNDMGDIAQARGQVVDDADLNKALIAFGIQAYYEQVAAFTKEAYEGFVSGVRFDRSMIAGGLTDIKGYNQYFLPYLQNHFSGEALNLITAQLPTLQDWFIASGAGSAMVTASVQAAFMLGADKQDQFTGSSKNDLIVGDTGNDILEGGKGEDILVGGDGVDTYFYRAGDGHDTIFDTDRIGLIVYVDAQGQHHLLDGGTRAPGDSGAYADASGRFRYTQNGANLTIALDGVGAITINNFDLGRADLGLSLKERAQSQISVILPATSDADVLTADTGADTDLLGGEGADVVRGASGNDIVEGGTGHDWLNGNLGNDALEGGEDNDFLAGGPGYDILRGGAGNDLLVVHASSGANEAVPFFDSDGATGFVGRTVTEQDWRAYFQDWQWHVGFLQTEPSGRIEARIGFDFLGPQAPTDPNAFRGVEYYTYGLPGLDTEGDSLFGGDGNDTLVGYLGADNLSGDEGDDYLDGLEGNDQLLGGSGNDWITGSLGDDFISGGAETLDAGTDNDTLFGEEGDDLIFGGAGDDVIEGDFHSIYLTLDRHGADTLFGGAGDDRVYGQGGDDYLDGEDGTDQLVGGAGADIVYGGQGNDQLFGDSAELAQADHGDDYLDGEDGDDYLRGFGGNDVLSGGVGNDQLLGEEGNDELDGGDGNDQLFGGTGDDSLVGGAGNDSLIGDAGADILDGGAGDDLLYRDEFDTVVFRPGDGRDTVSFASGGTFDLGGFDSNQLGVTQTIGPDGFQYLSLAFGNDSLSLQNGFLGANLTYQVGGTTLTQRDLLQRASSLILVGTDAADIIYGSHQADTLVGNGGDDVIEGQKGDDELDGGLGNDTYVFNPGDGRDTIADFDPAMGSIDTIRFGNDIQLADLAFEGINNDLSIGIRNTTDGITITDWFDSRGLGRIERIDFADGAYFDLGAIADVTRYTADTDGNRTGNGTGGDDSLFGGDGDDTLDGEAGDDSLTGGDGSDQLSGDDGDDVLEGGLDDDQLFGGSGGDTYRFGRGHGQDTIYESTLSPADIDILQFDDSVAPGEVRLTRQGADLRVTLDGTNDWITLAEWFGNGGKIEFFRFADGTEWDAAFVESLAVTGTVADGYIVGTAGYDELTGGTGNDRIYGGATSDRLNGGDGEDYLDGGLGNDLLNGGHGRDTYRISLGGGVDVVRSLQTGIAGYDYYVIDDQDTIIFGRGISKDALKIRLYLDNGDSSDHELDGLLIMDIDGTDGAIVEVGHLTPQGRLISPVERFVFEDGGEFSLAEMLPRQDGGIVVYEDAETLYSGTDNPDILIGGNFFLESMIGSGGDDLIDGQDGIDDIEGSSGADVIYGGLGTDDLDGDDGDDILAGGQNAEFDIYLRDDADFSIRDIEEYLDGGEGNDTYLYNRGDGYDVIYRPFTNEIDTLSFGGGINPGDVRAYGYFSGPYYAGPVSITLLIGEGTDRIELDGYSRYCLSRIDSCYPALNRVQFISEAGTQIYDLEGTLRALADRLFATDQEHAIPIFTEETAGFDITGQVEPAGGQYARDYALTGRLIPEDTYTLVDQGYTVIRGSTGNDFYEVVSSNSVINGGEGNDSFSFHPGNNTFSGGAGNDTFNIFRTTNDQATTTVIYGGSGNDTYTYNASVAMGGYGSRSTFNIVDTASPGGGNTLRFAGIRLSGVRLGFGSLKLGISETGDEIHLSNFDPNDVYGFHAIDTFEFDDGMVLSYADLIALGFDLTGTDGDDGIVGTNATDRITGGLGNDSLVGGAGDDTYYFGIGDGSDIILDTAGADSLHFGAGITSDNLITEASGNDILVYVGEDVLTIQNWFLGPDYQIEYIQFDDGSSFDAAWLESLSRHVPELAIPISDREVDEDSAFVFMLPAGTFTDQDLPRGDYLSIAATLVDGSGLPGWLGFDTVTGTFSGLADNALVGSYDITVTAIDSDGQSVSDTFTLTVNNVNDAPVLANALTDQGATEGVSFGFTIPGDTFHDDDAIHGDVLSYTASLADGAALPSWLSFDAATRAFAGTAPKDSMLAGTEGNDVLVDADAGIAAAYDIRVTATDAEGASTVGDFRLTLQGIPGDDTLEGKGGNDVLNGGAGNDSYLYNLGDGLDTLTDASGTDTIVLGTGYNFDNTVIRTDGNIARLRFLDADGCEGTDGMDIALDGDGSFPIEAFAFADGSRYTLNDLLITSQIWYGTKKADTLITGRNDDTVYADKGDDTAYGGSGHDTLYGDKGRDRLYGEGGNDALYGDKGDDILDGGAGDDVLDGGEGHNTLIGGQGDDILFLGGGGENRLFIYARDGWDTLKTTDKDPEDNDLVFGPGITKDSLWFSRAGNDLVINILGTDDGLTVEGWYNSKHKPLEEIQTSDGAELEAKQVELLVQAMAAFAPVPGADSTLPAEMPDALQATLAAAWETEH